MHRILRAGLRFSSAGFTYLLIASRLYVSSPSETSAHTGRRTSLPRLFCLPAMALPKNLVYAIPPPLSASQIACRVNDTPLRSLTDRLLKRAAVLSLRCNPRPLLVFPDEPSRPAKKREYPPETETNQTFSVTSYTSCGIFLTS